MSLKIRICRLAGLVALTAVAGWLVAGSALAQPHHPPERKLTVGVSPFPPLVMQNLPNLSDTHSGEPFGFDVELWQAVADELGVPFELKTLEFKDLLRQVRSGRLDAGLAGISITEDRERQFDFSHHYLDSGLRIMVKKDQGSDIGGLLSMLGDTGFWKWLAYFLVFLIVCGHIAWLSERGSDSIDDAYIPGIFQAFWFVIVTSTTVGYGDIAPKKWVGRCCSVLVMIAGIALSGIFIGHITTMMTVERLDSQISGLKDLRGKKTATVKGTTSVKPLQQAGVAVEPVDRIEDAYRLLEEGKVQAVVFDSPPLLHYAKNAGAGKVALVGPVLNREYYGIALPPDSPWREKINRALTKLRRNGVYGALYGKWFGSP